MVRTLWRVLTGLDASDTVALLALYEAPPTLIRPGHIVACRGSDASQALAQASGDTAAKN